MTPQEFIEDLNLVLAQRQEFKNLFADYQSAEVSKKSGVDSDANQVLEMLLKYDAILSQPKEEMKFESELALKAMNRSYKHFFQNQVLNFNLQSIKQVIAGLEQAKNPHENPVYLNHFIATLKADMRIMVAQQLVAMLTSEPDATSMNKLQQFVNQLDNEEITDWLYQTEDKAMGQVDFKALVEATGTQEMTSDTAQKLKAQMQDKITEQQKIIDDSHTFDGPSKKS